MQGGNRAVSRAFAPTGNAGQGFLGGKARRSRGDRGPARREINASQSRSSEMDMDGLGMRTLAVLICRLLPNGSSAAVAVMRRGRLILWRCSFHAITAQAPQTKINLNQLLRHK